MNALLTLLLALLPLSLAGAPPTGWQRLHTPSSTLVAGLRNLDEQKQLLTLHSLPYAQPPTGARRFRPPQPLEALPASLDARRLPATCMQMPHSASATSSLLRLDAEHRVSEDCLYLSMYIPLRRDAHTSNQTDLTTEQLVARNGRPLPTLVWFTGEGFDFADARQFDGSSLAAAADAIVVSVQYRVGVFGFLRGDALSDGNQGLWDQVQALQWLQTHLAEFGGDAKQVTVMGRFTGAMSLSILLTSPYLANRRLFDRAVLMSGVAVGDWVFDRRPDEKLQSLLNRLGCGTAMNATGAADCVKAASAEQLLAVAGFGWKPVYDGRLVVGQPIALLESGLFAANVSSVMLGSTEHDGALCYQIQQAMHSEQAKQLAAGQLPRADYLRLVRQDLSMFFEDPSQEQRLLHLISAQPSEGDHTERYMRFCSQLLIQAHQDRFAQLLRRRTNLVSYRMQGRPSFSSSPRSVRAAGFGDDVLLAFGAARTADDERMVEQMQRLIGAFVQGGSAALVSSGGRAPVGEKPLRLRMQVHDEPERLSQPLSGLRTQLSRPQAISGFGCQQPEPASQSAAPTGSALLLQLFQRASQRNATHVACAHSGSKASFMTVLRQTGQDWTAVPTQAS